MPFRAIGRVGISWELVSISRSKPKCIYCGIGAGTTKDHVPPKNLFSIPRPNLVTVPCCERCRQGQSLDDEYFVRAISISRQVGDNPAAAFAREAVHRAFTKPKKIGFTRALLASMNEVSVHSPAGLYLGRATTYDVDFMRLCNVIERTMRGLYFHEFSARLPDNARCVSYALDGFAGADLENIGKIRNLWQHALSGKQGAFGRNVFTYWVRRLDHPTASLWAFLVYNCVGFLAFTFPRTAGGDETIHR